MAMGVNLVKSKLTSETMLAGLEGVATLANLLQTLNGLIVRPDPQLIIDRIRTIKHTDKNTLKLTDELKSASQERERINEVNKR